jgi:alanine dehydrogenase
VTLLLTNEEVTPLLGMNDCLVILEEAYRAYHEGKILNIPWSMITVPTGKEDYVFHMIELRAAWPERGISAMRITSSLNDYAGGAVRRVLGPEGMRVDQVLLFDIHTGGILAILAGKHMQLLRVAATSALGVRYLARDDSETLGILGSGGQAETQLEAIALTRPLKRVLVYSRGAENRERFAQAARARYPFAVEAVSSADEVLEQSDVITAAASATSPIFDGSRVRPGTHVNILTAALVDDAVLSRASIFTTTKALLQAYPFPGPPRVFQGDTAYHQHWDRVQELERVMAGEQVGRQSPDEITLFYGDGAGLQFAALGYTVLQRARERGIGQEVPAGWLPGT